MVAADASGVEVRKEEEQGCCLRGVCMAMATSEGESAEVGIEWEGDEEAEGEKVEDRNSVEYFLIFFWNAEKEGKLVGVGDVIYKSSERGIGSRACNNVRAGRG
jgi:hypothetical protein